MKIKQVKLTLNTMLGQLADGNVYLVHDNTNHANKPNNMGRLTLQQLKHANLEEIIQRIQRGEEIVAIQVTED